MNEDDPTTKPTDRPNKSLEILALEKLISVQKEVRRICIETGQSPDSCRVLPVSKTISAEVLRSLCQSGQISFGENKVQELSLKREALRSFHPEWHFIGHLQTNKVQDCIPEVRMIHSVDRLKLGRILDQHLQKAGRSMEILVQVNTSGEASKFGVSPDQAIHLVRELSQFETLKIKGLMTLAVLSKKTLEVRKCFRLLKTVSTQIQHEAIEGVEMVELSMGMSSDYKTAVEEGSTIVRVGQEIFGPREKPDSYYWNENSTT